MLVVFLVLHVAVFRRHGLTVPDPLHKPDTTFWPDQVLKDAVACLAVSATVLFLAIRAGYGPNGGAELGAPAEPSEPYSAARPEWYFLFMFQFLKFFPGEAEVYGAIHIPGLVFGILVLAPIIGRWKVGHYFNVGFLIFILGGAVFLTGWAILEDSQDLVYRKAVADAHKSAARVRELVELKGITSAGAVQLLRDDSLTQGPKLFSRHCGACHRYTDEQHGLELPGQATASDLGHFGTREWAMGMLTDFNGDKHFGATKNDPAIGDAFITGEMAKWVAEFGKKANPDELKAIAEFLYSLGDRADGSAPVVEEAARGMELFALGSDTIGNACFNCHAMKVPNDPMGYFEGAFTAVTPAPDLTGYGSAAWLREFIRNPGADKFYGKRNHMIAFPVEKLSDRDLNMIVEWMLRRWPSRTGNVGSTPAAAH
jgi:ubiquinol-cytochrome c reductase cytochrome b subunit